MNTALISTFLWTLLVFFCPDTVWTTRAEDTALLEIKTKLTIIMDRMDRIEAEMETKDDRIEILEADLATKDNAWRLEMEGKDKAWRLEMEVKDQRIAALEEEMESVIGRITKTEETDIQLIEMVDQVRNPPHPACSMSSSSALSSRSKISCTDCDYKTKVWSNMRHHLESHHQDLKYACTVCGQTCKSSKTLGIHMQRSSVLFC